MKIAIASGKGGTGKTTLSLNLAVLLAKNGEKVTYVDCDVEEPNGHLFLNPSLNHSKTVGIPIPVVDRDLCDGCGKCSEICQFSAIVVVSGKALTFPQMCKGCGGCSLVCPQKAIQETSHEIGVVDVGQANGIEYLAGKLKVGTVSVVPLIREVKRMIPDEGYIIIDAPPGTSCPVIEAVKGSDVVILITEPTPFGLNDLRLASEMVREIGLPQCIVLNRAGLNNELIYSYSREEAVDIIAKIPDDRRIAESYSRGEMLVNSLREYVGYFSEIITYIKHLEKKQKVSEIDN